jgi:hypothetical protein
MLVFRWLLLLLFVAALLCFAMYVGTGQVHWRARGLRIVKWAVFAGARVLCGAAARANGDDLVGIKQ